MMILEFLLSRELVEKTIRFHLLIQAVYVVIGSHFICLVNIFFGIFRLHSQWDWNSLPESYRNSAYLTTDQGAIEDYFQSPDELMDHQLKEQPVQPSKCMHAVSQVASQGFLRERY